MNSISALFLEPLVHGASVFLRKVENLIGIPIEQKQGGANSRSGSSKAFVNLPSVLEQIAARQGREPGNESIRLAVDIEPDALVLGDFAGLSEALELLVATTLQHTPMEDCATVWGAVEDGVVTLIFSTGCQNQRIEESPMALVDRCFAGRMPPFPKLKFCPRRASRIVEAHGGYIEINNQLEHRSRIVVRLPVVSGDPWATKRC
jgi:signal transduction histidine kinase